MKVSLKAMRVNTELTQIEVAKKLDVPVDRIKYLETKEGSSRITYETLLTLCSIYHCTPDDIFFFFFYPESEVNTV